MAWGILCCVILTFSLPLTIFAGTECDVTKGEVYLGNHKVEDFAACEQACKNDADCRSITYYNGGSCDFFKTSCKATRHSKWGGTAKNIKGNDLNGKECDVSNGEEWLSGSTAASLADCKQSCEHEEKCQSITYYNHGACSHFSTKCEKTKPMGNAHSEKVKDVKEEEEEDTCETRGTCYANPGEECDVSNNEIYLEDGSGQYSHFDECTKACNDRIRCQSVTFYAQGWCSLFMTKCTNRRPVEGAVWQVIKDDYFNKEECDVSKGEIFLSATSGNVHDIQECRQSCTDEPECNSVTFFMSGFCSHFSTCCENRKPSPTGSADSLKLPTCKDPCKKNNGGCDSKRACTFANGQVTCGDCPAGYTNNGPLGCQKIPDDPCKLHGNNGGCDPKQKCINNNGAVLCVGCKSGYSCQPDDPCKRYGGNGGCDSKRKCINTNGIISCGDCPPGFTNKGLNGCDADPCHTNNGNCDSKRKCTFASGKVTCGNCPAGYTNAGPFGCQAAPTCIKPTNQNVQPGVRVKLISNGAAFKAAFRGKPYVYDNNMPKIFGTVQTVTTRSGPYAGRADSFGLSKMITNPGHRQPDWFYPQSVIECVLPAAPAPKPDPNCIKPTNQNVQPGVRVKLKSNAGAFKAAFGGKPYRYDNAMTKIFGTVQTVSTRSGRYAGRADSFGMTKMITNPGHRQPDWFYPQGVIECVLPAAPKPPAPAPPPKPACVKPTTTNVHLGSKIKLKATRAAFQNAFRGKPYRWDNAMNSILGKTVTVTLKSGRYAGRADSFGMPKANPRSRQNTWFYPIAVIECVLS